MKKQQRLVRTLSGLLAAGTLCAAMPLASFNAAQTLAGDVNLDGVVNVDDITLLQNYLLGSKTITQQAFNNADLTNDGSVDAFDLAALKYKVTPVSDTIYIHLSDSGITVDGDSKGVVKVSGKTASVTSSGVYYIDGSITDGQIYVETATDDTSDVELVLENVEMTNSTKPCIYTSASSGSEKTKITLQGESTLTDTSASAYTESGVIYTNNKLTITKNSTGILNINSSMNTGINSEKKLNLNGGTIIINTSDATADTISSTDADAIKSDKNIEIEGAVIEIDSSADGIKSDSGVYLYDGTVSIKAGNDAVQASTEIAVSGGKLTASGDRGLRLDDGGLLNITGGTVVATATDYQVNGNETIDMSGSTQAVMLLDMTDEWKKANGITVGSTTYYANKKYDYVLISDSSLTSSGTYSVYLGGSQAKHSTDSTGKFKNTGNVTQYYSVELLAGGETVTTGTVSSISFSSSGVTLYDASGNVVSADSSVSVSGSEVTIKNCSLK